LSIRTEGHGGGQGQIRRAETHSRLAFHLPNDIQNGFRQKGRADIDRRSQAVHRTGDSQHGGGAEREADAARHSGAGGPS
tara:strand:- start:903 stop:1142 length:240 start_codon:yes stop_codon:yes gene_type:complete